MFCCGHLIVERSEPSPKVKIFVKIVIARDYVRENFRLSRPIGTICFSEMESSLYKEIGMEEGL